VAKPSDPLRQFDSQLKDILAPMLEEHGFVRAERTRLWRRPSSSAKDVYHLVWFQIGESASTLGGQFTVELGLYYPKYDRFCNGRTLSGPGIAACHFDLRKRLGLFLPKPIDKWWSYNKGEDDLNKQIAAVVKLLTQHGLSWFEETDTPETAAAYNTGKLPEPDRLRREARDKALGAREKAQDARKKK
jgi:hypothetical protein